MAQPKKVRARLRKANKCYMTSFTPPKARKAIEDDDPKVAALYAEIARPPYAPPAPRPNDPENTRPPLSDEFVSLLLNAIRHSRGPSSFLTKLPVEIRLIIYGYVLDAICEHMVRYIFYLWRENRLFPMSLVARLSSGRDRTADPAGVPPNSPGG